MLRPLGIVVRLTLGSHASVPFGLGFISAPCSFPTPLPCLSDLFTDPGVLEILSFPSRLFLRKGLVLPCLGQTHSLMTIAESMPPRCGVPIAAL